MIKDAVFSISVSPQGSAFSYSSRCRLEILAGSRVVYFDNNTENRDISVKAIGFSENYLSVIPSDDEDETFAYFGTAQGDTGVPYLKIGFDIIEVGLLSEKLKYTELNNGFSLSLTGFLRRNDKKSSLMTFILKVIELN